MSAYVLVSLWAEDDEATTLSHAFALELHRRRPASAIVHGEAPAHEDLKNAVDATPDAAVILFAHGGPSLSARRDGDPWIRAEHLAAIASGRRVYAFACSTFVPQRKLLQGTFAIVAVDSCIRLFAGHEAPVMTPFADEGGLTGKKMRDALLHLIDSFIDGEDDQATLIDIGRMYASYDLPIELDLPSEDPAQVGALGWSSSAFLTGFFKSLRVTSKGSAAAPVTG